MKVIYIFFIFVLIFYQNGIHAKSYARRNAGSTAGSLQSVDSRRVLGTRRQMGVPMDGTHQPSMDEMNLMGPSGMYQMGMGMGSAVGGMPILGKRRSLSFRPLMGYRRGPDMGVGFRRAHFTRRQEAAPQAAPEAMGLEDLFEKLSNIFKEAFEAIKQMFGIGTPQPSGPAPSGAARAVPNSPNSQKGSLGKPQGGTRGTPPPPTGTGDGTEPPDSDESASSEEEGTTENPDGAMRGIPAKPNVANNLAQNKPVFQKRPVSGQSAKRGLLGSMTEVPKHFDNILLSNFNPNRPGKDPDFGNGFGSNNGNGPIPQFFNNLRPGRRPEGENGQDSMELPMFGAKGSSKRGLGKSSKMWPPYGGENEIHPLPSYYPGSSLGDYDSMGGSGGDYGSMGDISDVGEFSMNGPGMYHRPEGMFNGPGGMYDRPGGMYDRPGGIFNNKPFDPPYPGGSTGSSNGIGDEDLVSYPHTAEGPVPYPHTGSFGGNSLRPPKYPSFGIPPMLNTGNKPPNGHHPWSWDEENSYPPSGYSRRGAIPYDAPGKRWMDSRHIRGLLKEDIFPDRS